MVKVNTWTSISCNIWHIYTPPLSVLQLDTEQSDVTTVLTALQMYGGGETTVVRKCGEILRRQIRDDGGNVVDTSVCRMLRHGDT